MNLNRPRSVELAFALLACAFPPLIAFSLTPSATLFNQLAALAGWGMVLMGLADQRLRWRCSAAALALLVMGVVPWLSWGFGAHPLSSTLGSSGLLAAALLVLLAAQGLVLESRLRWFDALCWGLVVAGGLCLLVGVVQVFFPSQDFLPGWAQGKLIARSAIEGRAVGNMRQPNHLASLLMWSCVAAVYLADQRSARWISARAVLPVLLFGFVFTVVLSASRTGMIGVLILAIWGAFDRKLSRRTRMALLATPVMLAVSWGGLSAWSHLSSHAFGAESRLGEGAGSPARLAILANAWELLKHNPWAGIGWGEFNLAWTMTPFPGRPIAFFDHTHNIAMQLAVELGLPLGLVVLGLLCCSLWQAFRRSMREQGAAASMRRCAFMLVLMIGLHSLLEYPLWYAYFLLPTAFALGLALGGGADEPAPVGAGLSRVVKLGGWLMVIASIFAVWDYLRVVAIYVPSEGAASLEQRIRDGQSSLLFAPQADYAAATSLPPSQAALEATRRTGHNLIDVRLMIAWAKSLHETGDDDRARYVVQRLREFRSRQGDEWLAECDAFRPGEPKPFQCDPPSRNYEWREMR